MVGPVREFLAELRRRHVYRVAVIYAAAAWVVVQIADIILENFNVPGQVMQLLILGAALGFPVALILAWIYDSGEVAASGSGAGTLCLAAGDGCRPAWPVR